MRLKNIMLYVMASLYIVAGVNHFWHPETYLRIIPSFLPVHDLINHVVGVLEIVVGIFLIPLYTRSKAAWAVVVLLLLIFPANIQMAIDYKQEQHTKLWLAYLRLPLQAFLIWWAVSYTDWYKQRNNE